jgi:predicted metal-dependent hydrolase
VDRSAALVEIRRSERARRWRLELTPRGALLTVPRRTSVREVERIVEANLDWVERRLAERRPVLGLGGVCVTERAARALVRRRGGAIAAQEADAIGVSFARLQIRGQRTRWGSCSSAGTISLNWRLALAPPETLDYVVVHEVCHLRQSGHGRRFWALVESRRPGYRDHRDWLRRYGHELLAYAPEPEPDALR